MFLFACETSQSFCMVKALLIVAVNQALSSWIAVVSDQTWQKKKHEFVPLFTKLLYYSQFINSKYILHVTVYTLACCGHTFVLNLYVYVLQSVAFSRHAAFLYLRKEILVNNVADGVKCEDL